MKATQPSTFFRKDEGSHLRDEQGEQDEARNKALEEEP